MYILYIKKPPAKRTLAPSEQSYKKRKISECVEYIVKKYNAVWNQNLYIGEYSGISSLKLKNLGI
jgi:hypothetical protein